MNLYKINSQTGDKVLVGTWDRTTGEKTFLRPKKNINEIDKVNTYKCCYELDELELLMLDDEREVFVTMDKTDKNFNEEAYTNFLSIGYLDNGKLVLWSQYE